MIPAGVFRGVAADAAADVVEAPATGLTSTGPNMVLPAPAFEKVVLGESILWGQGLLEGQKASSLVRHCPPRGVRSESREGGLVLVNGCINDVDATILSDPATDPKESRIEKRCEDNGPPLGTIAKPKGNLASRQDQLAFFVGHVIRRNRSYPARERVETERDGL